MASGVSPATGSGGHSAPASGGPQKDSPAKDSSAKDSSAGIGGDAKSGAGNGASPGTSSRSQSSSGRTNPSVGRQGTGTGTTDSVPFQGTGTRTSSVSPSGDSITPVGAKTPIGSPPPPAPSPSPYTVGTTELGRAQADIDQLKSVTTSAGTYAGANSSRFSIPNLFDLHYVNGDYGKDAATIARANGLEDDANKNLKGIAAANVRGEVGPDVLKPAQGLGNTLTNRLGLDSEAAGSTDVQGDQIKITPLDLAAYSRATDMGKSLDDALNHVGPDALPLGQPTSSFLSQAESLHQKTVSDYATFLGTPNSPSARKDALTTLHADNTQLGKLYGVVNAQEGDGLTTDGAATPKIEALPPDDPLATAYQKQASALSSLQHMGGALFESSNLLEKLPPDLFNPPAPSGPK